MTSIADTHIHADIHAHTDRLHFAHPLFSESPSPDTKIRTDYIFKSAGGQEGAETHSVRIEVEYAIRPWVSLETNIPFTVRNPAEGSRENDLDTIQLGLKFASHALAEHGLLVGGGLEFGFPTGDSDKEIGSGNILEIEPFVDFGFARDDLEIVGFLSPAIPTNKNGQDEADVELGWSVSFLYHVGERFEALLELNGERVFGGEDAGLSTVSIAPGIKIIPTNNHNLKLGVGLDVPISDNKEFDVRTIVSVFYHF